MVQALQNAGDSSVWVKRGDTMVLLSVCVCVCLLQGLVLVLGLVLHHHLAALAHGEGEGALDVLRVAQLVYVFPEHLVQVRRHLLVERYLHQLGGWEHTHTGWLEEELWGGREMG